MALALLVALMFIGVAPAASPATPGASSSPTTETRWTAAGPAAKPGAAVLPTTTRSTGTDALPFSGIDLAFGVLVAGGLFLLGAALRRLSTRAPQN